jgi:2,5-diamino-6-(ribosylamino)-4(3H)-pyrimidinone 5'-phosphate reductase
MGVLPVRGRQLFLNDHLQEISTKKILKMNAEHNIQTGLPRIILHNTISLDGSLKGFEADLNIHYSIASSLKSDAYLVGSQTILDATEEIPQETKEETHRPYYDPTDIKPFWVVVDSRSRLKGILHYYRQMEYIKDIIVLISHATPKDYQQYLEERDYPFIKTGDNKVNLKEAFRELKTTYNIETVITDSGPGLNNVLLKQNLVDELSLVVAPYIVAFSEPKIFMGLELDNQQVRLKTLDTQNLGKDHLWLRYKVKK